ncbi:MAG: hypothetical protein SPL78_10465 [Bacteroidales bacterium]|nr:hypothetical protein [Bacteroidales bacterium]
MKYSFIFLSVILCICFNYSCSYLEKSKDNSRDTIVIKDTVFLSDFEEEGLGGPGEDYDDYEDEQIEDNIAQKVTKDCPNCVNGYKVCDACGGTKGRYFHHIYPNYEYDEWIPCAMCGGSGNQSCFICKGKGFIEISNSNAPVPVSPQSPFSIGSSSESSSKSYKEKYECPLCHGTGKCYNCAGRGEKQMHNSDGYYDCVVCNGSGRCKKCGGRGWYV